MQVLASEEKPGGKDRGGRAIRWSGVVPPRKWTTFYTKVIAKLTSSPDLRLQVSIEASAGDQAEQGRTQFQALGIFASMFTLLKLLAQRL